MKRFALAAALLLATSCATDTPPVGPSMQRVDAPANTSDPNDDFHSFPHAEGEEGSHFRLGHISWRKTGALTAEFTYVVAFRRSFYGAVSVGQTRFLANLSFGVGQGSVSPPFTVTFVDAANDWFEARAVFTKTFTNAGPHEILSTGCCRIGIGSTPGWAHMNNPDRSIRYWGTVNLNYDGNAASTLPAMVTCARSAPCTFFVSAATPAGLTNRWRFATSAEMGSGVQPGGATVDAATGLYQWNTTGAAIHPDVNRKTVYSTQIVIESVDGSGQPRTRSMIDFLILLANVQANAPPAFQAPTPADNSTYTVSPGQSLTLNLSATDANAGDVVTITGLGMPAGSSLTGTPGNPTNSVFTFTASAGQAGQNFVVSFSPTDNKGLSGPQRSIIINVPSNQPPVARITGPASGDEASGVTFDGSTSSDPDGDPLSYAWTVNGVVVGSNTPTLAQVLGDGPGSITVGLTVADGKGGTNSTTHALTIRNVAPTVDAGSDISVVSGQTASFSGTFTDPGVNDSPWTGLWSFGASNSTTTLGGPFTASMRYCVAGGHTVSLSVTDKDGGTGSDALVVNVARFDVSIDVNPEAINLNGNGHGMITVRIPAAAGFSPADLDPATLRLTNGAGSGTPLAQRNNGSYYFQTSGNGTVTLHFDRDVMIANRDLTSSTTQLMLLGTEGVCRQVRGVDDVRVIH